MFTLYRPPRSAPPLAGRTASDPAPAAPPASPSALALKAVLSLLVHAAPPATPGGARP